MIVEFNFQSTRESWSQVAEKMRAETHLIADQYPHEYSVISPDGRREFVHQIERFNWERPFTETSVILYARHLRTSLNPQIEPWYCRSTLMALEKREFDDGVVQFAIKIDGIVEEYGFGLAQCQTYKETGEATNDRLFLLSNSLAHKQIVIERDILRDAGHIDYSQLPQKIDFQTVAAAFIDQANRLDFDTVPTTTPDKV